MKALIIASGKIEDLSLLKKLVRDKDFILCADGGLDHLMKIDSSPDLVLGDLDSISKKALDFISDRSIEIHKFPRMKDETDTELAIQYLVKNGYKDITLSGVTGSRMDHTMANIFLLRDLKKRGISGRIVDDNNTIYFENNSLKLRKSCDYISIVPLNSEGISVSLKGFLYPLDKRKINFGATIGISNEIVEDYGTIEIHSGEALIFESRD